MSKLEPTLTYSNPTATEVLRRLLDERGVEWGNIRKDGSESDYLTEWQFGNNQCRAIAIEWAVGSGLSVEIHRYHLTPEQAIAATLGDADATGERQGGVGTCRIKPWKMERDTGFFDCMECSECGYVTDVSEWANATYCAGCGRRVEQ